VGVQGEHSQKKSIKKIWAKGEHTNTSVHKFKFYTAHQKDRKRPLRKRSRTVRTKKHQRNGGVCKKRETHYSKHLGTQSGGFVHRAKQYKDESRKLRNIRTGGFVGKALLRCRLDSGHLTGKCTVTMQKGQRVGKNTTFPGFE